MKITFYWYHGNNRLDMCFKSYKRFYETLKQEQKNYNRSKRFSKCYWCSEISEDQVKPFEKDFNWKDF